MIKKLLFILVVVLLFESCGTRVITRKYYILDFPADSDTVSVEQPITSAVCEIISVTMPPAYGQNRIAVRRRSHEISYYQYHHWAMDPGEILTNLIEKKVQNAALFSQTSRFVWKVIPEYQIMSAVHHLEAVDKDGFYAHLKMRLELYEREEKRVIVAHEFDRSEILSERDINLFAASISEILQQELTLFVGKMRDHFIAKTVTNSSR